MTTQSEVELPTARLRRAIQHAARRALGAARTDARSALSAAPNDPLVATIAGLVLFVTRDYGESLDALARAIELGAPPRVQWLRRERAARLGWEREAVEALEAGAAAEPDEPRWSAALLALHARRRNWGPALSAGEAVVRLAPEAPSPWMELAGVYASLGDRDATLRALRRALQAGRALPFHLEAARLARAVGAFDHAGALLDEVLDARPDEPRARLARAELALWAGDTAAAAPHIERLGDAPIARRLRGATEVLEGRPERARAHFEAATAGAPHDADAHAWLGELAIRDGRDDDAHAHITKAIAKASGRLFSGYVLRARVKIEEHTPRQNEAPSVPRLEAHLIEHLVPSLRAICPDHEPAFTSQHPDDWRALLDTALARMAGNRSSVATFVGPSGLQLVPELRDPRAESRRVLERIRLEDPEVLLAELEALAEDFPASPLPHAHRGELLAWLGRYDEARATLQAAIDITRGTRWAYIGLSAIDIVTGDPEKALATSAHGVQVMRNTIGPAVHVHDGEAALRLGRLDEAERSLRVATETGPNRLGGWLNLALLELQRGDVARAHAAFDEAFVIAPGLLSDAARELEVPLFGDAEALPAPADLKRVLEHARDMLRANRSSSCVTYFTSQGTLRFGRNTARDAEPVHAKDDDELRFALGLLDRGLAALPQPGDRRSRRSRDG